MSKRVAYGVLKVDEGTRMQRQQSDFTRCWCPVNKDKWERFPSVRMIQLIAEHDVSRTVLRELCYQSAIASVFDQAHTLCQLLDADIIKLLYFLHRQCCLVDLDDQRSVAFITTGKSELS